jgi:hypothetical protein
VVTLDPCHDTGQADVIALDTDTRRWRRQWRNPPRPTGRRQ